MRISTRITAEDHREYHYRIANRGGEKRRARSARWRLGVTAAVLLAAMASFYGALGHGLYRGDLAAKLAERPFLLAAVLFGLALSVFALVYLRSTSRLRRRIKVESESEAIDETGLRDGINIGAVDFDADAAGISASVTHVQSRLPWRAFRLVRETEENIYLVIDQGAALIVPKRGVDEALLQSFRTLVTAKVGGVEPVL